jgi:protein-S-isoprenylcysteine O-methyltransferase Ste14
MMAYRLAALVIGLIVGAYWARVARMARKARRRTGRAANFLPPEKLGLALRLIWAPVVVIWIGQPFVTAIGRPNWRILQPLNHSAYLAWPAAAVVIACFQATRACWKFMGKNWRMGIDPTEKNPLLIEGPFARVRHPIYALSQVMMLATVAAIPSPLMLLAGLAHLVLVRWEARREEAHLGQVHGQRYRDYCARVRRFVPSFSPSRSGAEQKKDACGNLRKT